MFVILQVDNGGGRHIGDVNPVMYSNGLHFNFITQPIYLWAICIVKMSVGLALLRIASEKKFKVAIYSVMGFMLVYTFGCFLVNFCIEASYLSNLLTHLDHYSPMQEPSRSLESSCTTPMLDQRDTASSILHECHLEYPDRLYIRRGHSRSHALELANQHAN